MTKSKRKPEAKHFAKSKKKDIASPECSRKFPAVRFPPQFIACDIFSLGMEMSKYWCVLFWFMRTALEYVIYVASLQEKFFMRDGFWRDSDIWPAICLIKIITQIRIRNILPYFLPLLFRSFSNKTFLLVMVRYCVMLLWRQHRWSHIFFQSNGKPLTLMPSLLAVRIVRIWQKENSFSTVF